MKLQSELDGINKQEGIFLNSVNEPAKKPASRAGGKKSENHKRAELYNRDSRVYEYILVTLHTLQHIQFAMCLRVSMAVDYSAVSISKVKLI